MAEFKIDDLVKRIASEKDYTNGRQGQIIEIKDGRCRVHWHYDRNGAKENVRTWVKESALHKILFYTNVFNQ